MLESQLERGLWQAGGELAQMLQEIQSVNVSKNIERVRSGGGGKRDREKREQNLGVDRLRHGNRCWQGGMLRLDISGTHN